MVRLNLAANQPPIDIYVRRSDPVTGTRVEGPYYAPRLYIEWYKRIALNHFVLSAGGPLALTAWPNRLAVFAMRISYVPGIEHLFLAVCDDIACLSVGQHHGHTACEEFLEGGNVGLF